MLHRISRSPQERHHPRVVPLGISNRERSAFMKDLPTVSETLPGFYFPMWVAIFAPAKTPKDIVDKMSAAIAAALKDPAAAKQAHGNTWCHERMRAPGSAGCRASRAP